MLPLKRFFGSKAAGFYVCLCALLLSLAAAVVYAACYNGTMYMSWWAFAVPLIAAAGFAGLSLFRATSVCAPAVLGLGDFTAFLLYIRHVYIYLSEVFYAGLSAEAFANIAPEFFACTLLFFAAFVLSVVGVCMRQSKPLQRANGKEECHEG